MLELSSRHALVRIAFGVFLVGAIAVGAPAQRVVVRDVARILAAGEQALWIEKGGTVWASDGTAVGTVDAGIAPAARFAVHGNVLAFYHPRSIEVVGARGVVTTHTVPTAYDGFYVGAASPTLWRRLSAASEMIEVLSPTASGWTRELRCLCEPSAEVEAVTVRPNAHWVLWTEEHGSTATTDILYGQGPYGHTGTGSCERMWTWSEGAIGCSESSVGSDAITFFPDDGAPGGVALPVSWGWGQYEFDVAEPTAGFPFLVSRRIPEIVPFSIGSGAYPVPGASIEALFWMNGGNTLIAELDLMGVRQIVTWNGSSWAAVPAFAGMTDLALLYSDGSRAFVSVRDPSGAHRVVAVDSGLGSITSCLQGLLTRPGPLVPFGDGFAFAAEEPTFGKELWFTRGGPGTTRMLADLARGPVGANPSGLVVTNSSLMFVAQTSSGRHLFAWSSADLSWHHNPHNGHWYRLTEAGSWSAVRDAARRDGGELVAVNDASEQSWLWNTFGPRNLWIGLEDLDRDGTFEWLSGEPLNYTAWCAGEPNRSTPGELVVHIANYAGQCAGGWNDQEPTDLYRSIVERASPPAAIERIGTGCDSLAWSPPCHSLGAATLTHIGGAPVAGGRLEFRFDGLQTETSWSGPYLGFAILGLDNTRLGSLDLPLDLETFGWAPGCTLHTSIDDTLPLALDRLGSGNLTLPIPSGVSFGGHPVFVQGLLLSSRQLPGCRESSNALRIRFAQ